MWLTWVVRLALQLDCGLQPGIYLLRSCLSELSGLERSE